MSNLKLKSAIILACLMSAAFTAPILATAAADYQPGVSAGQWIKYGNLVASGASVSPSVNDTDWMQIDITDVSGKNVTMHMSGQYKNGTAVNQTSLTDLKYNVETGWANTSIGYFVYLIAANLEVSDVVPGTPLGLPMSINKTETRSYLSANRDVNIINITMSIPATTDIAYISVYDKATGMLLELSMNMTSTVAPSTNMYMSFSVADTNMFATGWTAWLQDNLIYIVIVIIVIIVVIAAAVLMRRKKPPAETPPAETKT